MRSLHGGEVGALCLVCALLLLVTPAVADPVVPTGAYFAEGDAINFNFAGYEQLVFDTTIADEGALIDFDGASGGTMDPYPEPNGFTLGLRWTVPLVNDWSGGGYAYGEFGALDATPLTYELVDLDNAGEVLLSGEIMRSPWGDYDFIVQEGYTQPNKLMAAYGGGAGGGILLTVTGGLLDPYYPSTAEMFISYDISYPTEEQGGVTDFTTDLYTIGNGTVDIVAGVPEPLTLLWLVGGTAAVAARRRRS